MQLKYSLKKEWAHFARTFRFAGVIIAALAVAIFYPLLFKFTGVILGEMTKMGGLSVAADPTGSGLLGGMSFSDMTDMYFDAGIMFSVTMSSMFSMTVLIIMLIIGSAAGGEQKKRAMIIPLCSGLSNKDYVLAKFIIYPTTAFVTVFLAGLLCGVLCNALFPNNKFGFGLLLLGCLLAGIYVFFIVSIYLSLGICTSKPIVMAAIVFVGSTLIDTILKGLNIVDYNPFTLSMLVSGGLFYTPDFPVANYAASIAVGIAISLLVSALMCLLAIAVLNAKKIDNTEEKKPEF